MPDEGALARWWTERRNWLQIVRTVRRQYADNHGRPLRLLSPRLFTEKMQWRKLFDDQAVFTGLSNKLAVRAFIEARLGPGYTIAPLWVGERAQDLPLDDLVAPFIVKSTHASGHAHIVERDDPASHAAIRTKAEGWLAQDYALFLHERGYRGVEPRLVIEPLLTDENGAPPLEHLFHAFGGKVGVIQTVRYSQGERTCNIAFHDPEWRHLGWRLISPAPDPLPARPPQLEAMIAAAERLASGFDYLRVDTYATAGGFRIGELTLYSWSGLTPFQPHEADEILGRLWRLSSPLARALWQLAFSRWGKARKDTPSPLGG